MFSCNVVCHLWDLVDEQVDPVLDFLLGELGVREVCVPAWVDALTVLRPHRQAGVKLFSTDGGLLFKPDPQFYGETRLIPVAADWLKSKNPLAKAAKAVRQRGMKLRVSLGGCRNSHAAKRNPAMSCKNLFGEVSAGWLCAADDDVIAFLAAVAADVTAHCQPDVLELEDFNFPSDPHPVFAACPIRDLGEVPAWLMSLCFSGPCCRKAAAADIDVEAVIRTAVMEWEKAVREERHAARTVARLIKRQPLLRQYVEHQSSQVTGLIQSILDRAAPCVLVRRGDLHWGGQQPAPMSQYLAGQMAICRTSELSHIEQLTEDLRVDCGGFCRPEMRFSAAAAMPPDSQTLVRNMTRAAEVGIQSVQLVDYGAIPERRLAWIKQAARFARRTASS